MKAIKAYLRRLFKREKIILSLEFPIEPGEKRGIITTDPNRGKMLEESKAWRLILKPFPEHKDFFPKEMQGVWIYVTEDDW